LIEGLSKKKLWGNAGADAGNIETNVSENYFNYFVIHYFEKCVEC